jgi:hypothetical protein
MDQLDSIAILDLRRQDSIGHDRLVSLRSLLEVTTTPASIPTLLQPARNDQP